MQWFVRISLQLEPYEIMVMGPPWDTTVCPWFTDQFTSPDGDVVYTNCDTIFGEIVWGKPTSYVVYEDTQKVAEGAAPQSRDASAKAATPMSRGRLKARCTKWVSGLRAASLMSVITIVHQQSGLYFSP